VLRVVHGYTLDMSQRQLSRTRLLRLACSAALFVQAGILVSYDVATRGCWCAIDGVGPLPPIPGEAVWQFIIRIGRGPARLLHLPDVPFPAFVSRLPPRPGGWLAIGFTLVPNYVAWAVIFFLAGLSFTFARRPQRLSSRRLLPNER
jgi:hypothetical protein